MPNPNGQGWLAVERAAREQAQAELFVMETTPLVIGAHVLWTECTGRGVTDGLSPIHRVAQPKGEHPKTFCDEIVPPPVRRVAVGQAFLRTMQRCRWCEEGYSMSAAAKVSA